MNYYDDEDLENELNSLRYILHGEYYANNPKASDPADYENDLKPLVIAMEEFLKEEGVEEKDDRRFFRLKMLGIITKRKLRTSYDLSKFQANTIYFSLFDPDRGTKKEFLKRLKRRVEKPTLSGQESLFPKDAFPS